ncbi:hypothetical protein B0T22DRAFT_483903 [Podospora appendiculata]|uniref:Uncharacterized protein n=1 Tax=Podospora appendiculata TaxID=314037 RepID=A0AAE0X3J8_9PEZI|nr:hypothetical protein B0T22DRAFT_483903 [Podospora appendiculata]
MIIHSGFITYNTTEPTTTLAQREAQIGPESKRGSDYCGGGGSMDKSHISGLQNWLQNTNAWTYIYLPHQSVVRFSYGSAMMCLKNQYWTENTHVARWEAGWATGYVSEHSVNAASNFYSAGGQATAHGDSGLALDAVLLSLSYACKIY